MNVIETNNLEKGNNNQYRVKNVNLKVQKGCVYGFLGPNGAGKTTTLKLILGLIKPTAGEIRLFEEVMTERRRLALLRDIGSLIESPSYYGHLTGEENLKIAARLKNISEKEIAEVLHTVRLTEQKGKKVGQYSLGMKQRLGIAMALLGNPKLLILDEPTNGLDPAGIQEMRELIMELPKKYDMTILISSHILSEMEQISDMVGIISKGQLVYQDSMEKLHSLSKSRLCARISDVDAGQEILRKMQIQYEVMEDGTLSIPVVEDRYVAVLVRNLMEEGIMVYRLEERSKKLEEIFLEMTGGGQSL